MDDARIPTRSGWKHPAEWVTFVVGLVGFGVQLGILDEPTAAWLTGGLGVVPGIITGAVNWWRSRPGG